MYQGFFLAPHVVSQSLKGALFTSLLLEKINMKTSPKYNVYRTDLIQTVQFETKEQMISFAKVYNTLHQLTHILVQNPSICLDTKMMSSWLQVHLFRARH